MAPSDSSLPQTENWLRDEPNRLAQNTPPKQQELVVKLITPLMSGNHQHISPSPPSKGLAAPLEPLFGMAHSNSTQQSPRQTPQKPQSGGNAAFITTTRRSRIGNAGSPGTLSTHQSTPSARRPPLTSRQSPVFSSSSASPMSPTSPARAIHESIEQRRETSLAQRVLTPSPHTANLKKASKPSKSASRGKPSQESHSTFRTSNYSQQPKVHTTTISNIVRLGDGEDFDDQTDDEMVEEEEFHGLSEARHLFSGKDLPDFVLRRPTGGLTRNVVFRPRNQPDGDFLDGELVFEFWDKEKTRGFWTLRDDVGFGWIVKYSLQDRGYRAWMGVEFGFDQRCLAYPQGQKQSSETQRRASRSTVVEDSEESEVELIDNRRTFRKRNIDQVHPYTTEKSNYKRSRYGKRKENFKKEYTSGASPGLSVPISVTKGRAERSNGRSRTPPLSKLGAPQTKETSKSRLSSGSTDTKATPSNEPEPVSLERIQNDTTLYVFINSDFEDAPATVYLKSCKDINSLFSIVALVAGIKEDDIRILTVQFDWLPYSIPNTIRMIKGLSDSYEKLIEEVREAPAWRKGGEGRVGVYVNVVLR